MANRLENAKSPYLLEHAAQPIDWYPWSAEAFERAREEDKPVLLSIGYSACHWCHTMAAESFSDPETAKLINQRFIPVKVDREERPDIDSVYMEVCQTLTNSGGWPLHLLLTPSKKPFFAGTYYPKEDREGMIGFRTLLKNAADAWSERRQELVDTAGKITDILNREKDGMYKEGIAADAAARAKEALSQNFDKENGGFYGAPKFPMPQIPFFLMEYGRKCGSVDSRRMAEKTLQKMYDGGLFDHVGGGFFRYAVDDAWHRPHFEKMLTDNAFLALALLEAGEQYVPYAEKTLAFLKRDMQSTNGAFYSAVSATTAEGEGAYYLWDAREVRNILGKEAKAFCKTFHIMEGSLPYIEREDASAYKEELSALLQTRQKRPMPSVDKKILTAPNALTATAFARAGQVQNNAEYIETAKTILHFINTTMRDKDGRLLCRYFEGDADIRAFSEDYAYLMWAQLALYEATGEKSYLQSARESWADVINLFWDERGGAYFCARDAEEMIARLMEGHDGALPSANAVFALCLVKLFKATGDVNYQKDMQKIFDAFGGQINQTPDAFCFMLYAKMKSEE